MLVAVLPRTETFDFMKLALLALLLAATADPSLLAPGPQELRARMASMGRHLDEADAVGRAAARIHNRLAEEPAQLPMCGNEAAQSLLARSRIFGQAYRARVQAARADGVRLRRLLAEPTIEPIVGRELRLQADALLERVEDHERRYGEIAAWQARFAEPQIARCKPGLEAGPGIPGEPTRQPAVVGIGGGRICPGGLPADGTVVVLPEPRACYGQSDCSCAPVPVLPGAVLGP